MQPLLPHTLPGKLEKGELPYSSGMKMKKQQRLWPAASRATRYCHDRIASLVVGVAVKVHQAHERQLYRL
eukprot:2850668-Amphidinium_carterae.2